MTDTVSSGRVLVEQNSGTKSGTKAKYEQNMQQNFVCFFQTDEFSMVGPFHEASFDKMTKNDVFAIVSVRDACSLIHLFLEILGRILL